MLLEAYVSDGHWIDAGLIRFVAVAKQMFTDFSTFFVSEEKETAYERSILGLMLRLEKIRP
jgi:hypothetical protein